MAHWNGKNIIYFNPIKSKYWPKWDESDCGCCSGIEWGGESPRECKTCGGKGFIFVHRKTGIRVQWPGGPFC